MNSGKQLTFKTLGGEVVTVQQRGKHYIQPRGYAYFPGTGPAGETCGTCAHISRGRRWCKCELTRPTHTHSRGTDILVRAPACKFWEAADKRECDMIPQATIRIECAMVNPPKPIGGGIFVGNKMIAVVTLEQLKRAAAQVEELEAAAVKRNET